MGEAKRRAANDPSYGKAKRGLVVSCPMEISGTHLHVKSPTLDPQELRFSLLFWDELAWPASRIIHFAGGADEQFLETCGVLSRPEFTFNGDMAQGMAMTQIQAFKELEKKEPGKWALAQGENSFLLQGQMLTEGTGTSVELHRAIPVPDRDVPIAEILEFKNKRQNELGALRSEIDSFVANIKASADHEAELVKQIGNLDAACADTLNVFAEWQFPFRLSTLKCSFDNRPLVNLFAGVAAFHIADANGLPLTTSLIAGLIGGAAPATATIKLSGDFGWGGLRPRPSPYRYVSQYHRELFGV